MNDHTIIKAMWSLSSVGGELWRCDFCFERYHGEIPFSPDNFALQIIQTRPTGQVCMAASHAAAYGERVRDITHVLTRLPHVREAWVRPDAIVLLLEDPDVADVARHALSAVWGPYVTLSWQQDRRGHFERRSMSRDTPDRRAGIPPR